MRGTVEGIAGRVVVEDKVREMAGEGRTEAGRDESADGGGRATVSRDDDGVARTDEGGARFDGGGRRVELERVDRARLLDLVASARRAGSGNIGWHDSSGRGTASAF